MNPDDPKFTAHALGELEDLTPEERAEIEALLASDPAALSEAQETQALATRLRAELSGEEAAALSDAQRAAVLESASEVARTDKVVRFPWRRTVLAAAAACVIIGAAVAVLVPAFNAEKEAARRSLAVNATMSPDSYGLGELQTSIALQPPSESIPQMSAPSLGQQMSATTPQITQPVALAKNDARTLTLEKQLVIPHSTPLAVQSPMPTDSMSRAKLSEGVNTSAAPSTLSALTTTNFNTSSSAGMEPNKLLAGPTTSTGATTIQGVTLAGLGDSSRLAGWADDETLQLKLGTRLKSDAPASPAPVDALERSNTEAFDAITENAFLVARENPLSTFSIDVDTASYALVRRFLNGNQRPPKGAVRIEELLNYFTYDYPQPQGDAPFSATMEVAACPWTPEHRLVRIGLKGREMTKDKRPASNLVFLIDVSGSMKPDNKLPLLKQSLALLIEQLGGEDQVAMVVYAGSSGTVLEPTRDKEKMLAALRQLEAGGSTNGASGLHLAYQLAEKAFIKGGANRVILATDGDWNVGVTSQSDLLDVIAEKAKSGVFLTVLGLGMGNLNDSMMVKLAGRGNGNYAYLDTVAEARKVLVEQLSGTLVTIAKDVKIQVEFNPAEVGAYRLIGYEKRMLAKEDFNDDKKDAGEIGAGHTVTALYEVVPTGKDTPALAKAVDPLKYQPTPRSEPLPALLQSSDKPGDVFVSAYMAMQKGEKYEQQGELNAALERFQYAASLLDQLAEKGPAWQPAIVKYRKGRASAAVARILRKMEYSQQEGAPKILPPSATPARPMSPEKSDVFDFKSYLLEEKKVAGSASAPLEDKSTTRDLEPANSRELLTLKLRYKEPEGETSKLLEFPLTDSGVPWEQSSRDLRFAAAVAGYGMLLRDSPHKGQATWSAIAEWAQEGLGADASGYRAEFLTLIEKARALTR